jgi:hypothetical protein
MNATALELLLALESEQTSAKSLAESLSVTYARASELVRQLLQEGFVTKTGGLVGFRWGVILDELYHQEQRTTARFCLGVLDSIEIMQERASIRAPFYNKLVNHCIDHAIMDLVKRRKLATLPQIRELIDYPDYRLRSRIEKLVREGKLMKRNGAFTL